MPKALTYTFPLNGLLGVAKPSGMTSMAVVEQMQSLFVDSPLFVEPQVLDKQRGMKKQKKRKGGGPVKMGQGGTLDPLADGVLVVGVGKGTKSLGRFLHCSKEYRTIGLLGCETDSYDSDGARVRIAPWKHVTRSDLEEVLAKFRGPIKQMPPIFSALKMDGKPLYEYAREGKALPRPIEFRDANVLELELIDWLEPGTTEFGTHPYVWPMKELSQEDKDRFAAAKNLVADAEARRPTEEIATANLPISPTTALQDLPIANSSLSAPLENPPAFSLRMVVSSGTYVRSIVHDIGLALGSAAHVVSLTRTRQGDFKLPELEDDGNCVPWEVLAEAYQKQQEGVEGSPLAALTDESKRSEWEKAVLSHWHEP